MTQKGTIIKTEKNKALVAIPRPSACGEHCASCSGGCKAKGHLVWLENPLNANPGDKVLLSAPTLAVLSGSFWVYLFPLLLLFMGYGIAFSVTNSTKFATFISILSLFFGFFIVHLLDKKIAPKTKMIQIISVNNMRKDEENGI